MDGCGASWLIKEVNRHREKEVKVWTDLRMRGRCVDWGSVEALWFVLDWAILNCLSGAEFSHKNTGNELG